MLAYSCTLAFIFILLPLTYIHSDRRIRILEPLVGIDTPAYLMSQKARKEKWYGKLSGIVTDPPWGCLKDQAGAGEPDEALTVERVKQFLEGAYEATDEDAFIAIRLILKNYHFFEDAATEAGWLVQRMPKWSYKGAKYIQQRNTPKGHLAGNM